MAYNYWVMMDKVDVAVRHGDSKNSYTGYIVPHGDKSALEKAKDWARTRDYNFETREYGETHEATVRTFDNKGFKATILESAGGSSQGGRLSFWRCKMEKDGVTFYIGVNDSVLADLIRNSTIVNGEIREEVMFARKGGQPGLIHEGMQAYKDATADMSHKADMKKAKKTSKWEIGGVYSSITQMDICIGKVWDMMKEVVDTEHRGYYPRNKLVKRETPVEVYVWIHWYDRKGDFESLEDAIKKELESSYVYYYAGKPPARAKSKQLEVKETDLALIDELIKKSERGSGRYKRVK